MKVNFKKNWFFQFMGLFVLINVILVVYNFVISKQRKNEYQKLLQERQSFLQERQLFEIRRVNRNLQSDFYNLPCPEVIKESISGENIKLSNLVGNVIIIRFSRFYRLDLPNLVYLQHLADKYRNQGVSLIFINSLGKHDKEAINKIANLSYPIIEDNGSLMALFNASPEETIIVDREFTIKFKYRLASKSQIYNEVMKWAFKNQPQPISTSTYGLAKIIKNLTFYDVLNEERKRIKQIKNKKILLTLFTSMCTGCEENARIQLLKKIATKIDSDKVKILLLFGKGNNITAIRKYAILNEWNEFPFSVGVIEASINSSDIEYFKIFQLNVDPRSFIFNEEKTIFAETIRSNKLINPEYLKKLLQ